MSWQLKIAHRSYCAVTLFCRHPLSLHLMQRRQHVSPPESLARPNASDAKDISSRRRPITIQTLDPSRLRPSDFIDASSQSCIIAYGRDKSIFQTHYHCYSNFPEGTRGFLYYHSPEASDPPTAGEIRFRLTTGNDPASFNQGSDLRAPNGLPWIIHLLATVENTGGGGKQIYQPIKQLLVDDRLVTPALLETCAAMVNASGHPRRNSRIIHSFGQLFHIKFDARVFKCFILSKTHLYRLFYNNFSIEKHRYGYFAAYSGSALCCFERSSLPEHRGKRTAVVRIVKIISPVQHLHPNYDGPVPMPVEGELVYRIYKKWGLRPLSFNVDSPKYTGLKILFGDES